MLARVETREARTHILLRFDNAYLRIDALYAQDILNSIGATH